ncbi:MAG TPA: HPr family phosphocarrier protein [Firmicutes bacterium]|jgi:phosphocarrier protein|nr:HPr family phosphocarrier protein [Bacillota bacterium]
MEKVALVITAASGLHARPAGLFVKTAAQFVSSIKISKGEKEVNGKSPLALMTLGAKQGDSVTITAEGLDEKEAIQAFVELFERGFEE